MSPSRCLLLGLLLLQAAAIYLPVRPNHPRCMMVYTIGETESVKVELTLPQLNDHQREEQYKMSMRNTQDQTTLSDTLAYGSFKREYDLSPNVIYEFCIVLSTSRAVDNIQVKYSAETVYQIDHKEIKVPDNLLKKEDFRGTYEAAFRMGDTIEAFTKMQAERDGTAEENFVETTAVDRRLITISVVEILIIVAAGVYQFYSLQSYLVSKQYI